MISLKLIDKIVSSCLILISSCVTSMLVFILCCFILFSCENGNVDNNFLHNNPIVRDVIPTGSKIINGTHYMDSGLVEIKLEINESYNDLVKKMKEQCANISEKYNLGIYSIKEDMTNGTLRATFSNNSMVVILNKKRKNYYELKIR